ncbi:hypothetical protein KI809_09455 [Geobacter pelophilus]|uniref:Uncharacterized protein n=1 Tax=Geoanaerobacter pelophilus TaxID=60036 RepID=A0AAW4L7G7_9BACT|nr:hypothetical protein [Geoanaerobacter pelophilus]MBT0664525.1 hypothetical protein [Geoanaerobacter pelophilus]
MKIKIGPTDLKPVLERKSGFGSFNTGKVGCTDPWWRLESVGLSTLSNKKSVYSGPVDLAINLGGIRNKHTSEHHKTIFEIEVYPAIMNFAPDCGPTFHLMLYYREDLLLEAEMVY